MSAIDISCGWAKSVFATPERKPAVAIITANLMTIIAPVSSALIARTK